MRYIHKRLVIKLSVGWGNLTWWIYYISRLGIIIKIKELQKEIFLPRNENYWQNFYIQGLFYGNLLFRSRLITKWENGKGSLLVILVLDLSFFRSTLFKDTTIYSLLTYSGLKNRVKNTKQVKSVRCLSTVW